VLSLTRCATAAYRPPPFPRPFRRHGDAEAAIFHEALLTFVYPDNLACSVEFTDCSNQSRKALKPDQTNAAGPTRPPLLYLLMPSQIDGCGRSRLLVGCLAVYPSPPETIVDALEFLHKACTIAKRRCQHPFPQGGSNLSKALHNGAHRRNVV